ncbi:MAG TPA: dihydroxyacetone kinase subunit L [Candidatus Aerophobetes bacterium]|uniref:Dihydroxyacetone kinase subunit L n=1 Tax=Aerophobetes bacterium TaxID=2030807 RepID=A0A7V5I0A8_UNCAE|nr:dihydroxyacetone kinase subunit L [Candidatus Aerophobetes bacterium]
MASSKIVSILQEIVKVLEGKQEELNRLDANIGDGDHGRTVAGAFKNVLKQEKELEGKDIGEALQIIGRTLAFSTGAATGPLYGSAFIEAGKKLKGKEKLSLEDWKEALSGAVEGVKRRGKAEVGDKTMLDTLYPIAKSLEDSIEKGESLKEALLKAKDAAKRGMESTKELVSKRGRSSRLGERTKGHIDPGAASSYYVIETIIKSCLKGE